jgi:hypothetical protein
VDSYFALRKVSIGKDEGGLTRIFLNNEPLFMVGPLDQGFWPDGLYTAPTDEALRYDIEVMRSLGFNMARKHVKIEPDRWYYWADRLGLLVWQDMPSGRNGMGEGTDETVTEKAKKQFEAELKALIDAFSNHPSIVMWVVFNEGWGQYDTKRITEWVKTYDPGRLVNCASGWHDKNTGDVMDIHAYPGPASPQPEPVRAAVLGEFGGLGLPVKDHTWQKDKNWGYRNMKDKEQLTERYVELLQEVRWLIARPGLSAAVYTQITDVEIEVNGLLTYDRAVLKVDETRLKEAHRKLHLPPPKVLTLVPTSETQGQSWQYTFEDPGPDWFKSEYDDKPWPTAWGGFGTEGTPGAKVRTEWKTKDIWLWRVIDLPQESLKKPHLLMHHDEDAEVYINGVLAAKAPGYTTSYRYFPIAEEAGAALRPGPNLMAVHCRQTAGGQYIDVGLVDLIEPSPK